MCNKDEDIIKGITNLISLDKELNSGNCDNLKINFEPRVIKLTKKPARYFSILQIASVLLIVSSVFMIKNHSPYELNRTVLTSILHESLIFGNSNNTPLSWSGKRLTVNQQNKIYLELKLTSFLNQFYVRDYTREEFEELVRQSLIPYSKSEEIQTSGYKFNRKAFEENISKLKSGKGKLLFDFQQ